MPIAFKEWAVTVRALAEGEQLITLRKGGIREPEKHFELEHERFFLYPTFDHQRDDLVRESHQPELLRALEEGVWPDGEPPLHALTRDGDIPQPDRVRIRAWAEVADHWTITDRRAVDALSPFYVWTPDYAEKRLAWKRRHPLHVAAAAHLPHPAPRHGARCATTTAAAAPGWRSRATCRSRARPCSPTTSSSAPPRKSPRSSRGDRTPAAIRRPARRARGAGREPGRGSSP